MSQMLDHARELRRQLGGVEREIETLLPLVTPQSPVAGRAAAHVALKVLLARREKLRRAAEMLERTANFVWHRANGSPILRETRILNPPQMGDVSMATSKKASSKSGSSKSTASSGSSKPVAKGGKKK